MDPNQKRNPKHLPDFLAEAVQVHSCPKELYDTHAEIGRAMGTLAQELAVKEENYTPKKKSSFFRLNRFWPPMGTNGRR